jgi:hypothetical protein
MRSTLKSSSLKKMHFLSCFALLTGQEDGVTVLLNFIWGVGVVTKICKENSESASRILVHLSCVQKYANCVTVIF